jgi:flagellar basal-body rod modification protein FlgD
MSVQATESTTGGAQFPWMPQSSSPTGTEPDKEMFLKLLVTQLRYQDPLNPTDSSQFLAQSAQFTSLEKMQDVADRTGALLGAQLAFGASGLVGRNVTYQVADGTTSSGTVSGVSFGPEGPVLDVNGEQVPIGTVLSVTDGTTPAGSGTTSTP